MARCVFTTCATPSFAAVSSSGTSMAIGKAPTRLTLADLDAQLILSFLDHLEKERSNGARIRNARLAALRSFLKCAATTI